MATRQFSFTGTITVENSDVKFPARMEFSHEELQAALKKCVLMDIDVEGGEASLGKHGDNAITGIALDWDTLKEMPRRTF